MLIATSNFLLYELEKHPEFKEYHDAKKYLADTPKEKQCPILRERYQKIVMNARQESISIIKEKGIEFVKDKSTLEETLKTINSRLKEK